MLRSRNSKIFAASLAVMAAVTCFAQLPVLTGSDRWIAYTPPFMPIRRQADPEHLGLEIYNVGHTLYERGSFADPFREPTGPTAWVAPALPTLFALGLVVTGGSKTALATLYLGVQALILAGLLTFCIAIGRRFNHPWLAAICFAVVAAIDFRYCFQLTHDSVFLAGLIGLVLFGLTRQRTPTANSYRAIAWGIFGGLCALASPVVGLAWGTSTAARCWRSSPFRWIALSFACAALTVTPWVVRNRLVLDAWVPIKSNGPFELYQSLADEPTGVVTVTSMRTHPYHQRTVHGERYRQLGEIAFVREKRRQFWTRVDKEMASYFHGAFNRFAAATIHRTNTQFPVAIGWWQHLVGLLYPLAFFGFVATLLNPPQRDRKLVRSCQVIYVTYLVPYILVSFYARYAVPLLIVRSLLTLFLLTTLLLPLVRLLSGSVLSRVRTPRSRTTQES